MTKYHHTVLELLIPKRVATKIWQIVILLIHMPNGGGPIDLKQWIEEHPEISEENFRFLVGHSLAHLRTPLAGIKGYLTLLEDGEFEGENVKELYHNLRQAVDGVTESINDIVNLKLAYERQAPHAPQDVDGTNQKAPTILHFEDDNFLANMYAVKFRQAGFRYIHYENPTKDPAAIVLKENPDLILMNVIMPEMDGFRATEIIKADGRVKKIPLVFLTNLGQKEDKARGMGLGASKYILTSQNTPDMVINGVCQVLGLPPAFRKNRPTRKQNKNYPASPYTDLPSDRDINRGAGTNRTKSFIQRLFRR